MNEFISAHGPVVQAVIGTSVLWLLTTLGAAGVFLVRDLRPRMMAVMLGFAAGIMMAASFFSLLSPAIEEAKRMGWNPAFPTAGGFAAGALFLFILDRLLPHLHIGFPESEAEGIRTGWHKSALLIMAITLHNIPEGMAVGVAFGSLPCGTGISALCASVVLALGIGIQDIPEGLAVSAPLRAMGMNRGRAFMWGSLSGLVEPVAGILAAVAVVGMQPLMPWALSFSAGAMFYIVIEELIPESQNGGHPDLATMSTMAGFILMMVLNAWLGG